MPHVQRYHYCNRIWGWNRNLPWANYVDACWVGVSGVVNLENRPSNGSGDRLGDATAIRADVLNFQEPVPRETAFSRLCRWTIWLIGIAVATAMFVISASMNFRFGLTLGTTVVDNYLYAFASLAADGFKALLPFVIIGLWYGKQRLIALGAVGVWVLCVVWSLASAIGFASSTRDDTTALRAATSDERRILRERAGRLEQRIKLLPPHRPAAVVDAEIKNAALPRRIWVRTAECTDVTRDDSLRFCQPVLELRRELAVAKQAADLEKQLATVRGRLSKVKVVSPRADPQGETIASIVKWAGPQDSAGNVEASDVRNALAALITILIEAGSSLGFTMIVLGVRGMPKDMKTPVPRRRVRAERQLQRKLDHLMISVREQQMELEVRRIRAQIAKAEQVEAKNADLDEANLAPEAISPDDKSNLRQPTSVEPARRVLTTAPRPVAAPPLQRVTEIDELQDLNLAGSHALENSAPKWRKAFARLLTADGADYAFAAVPDSSKSVVNDPALEHTSVVQNEVFDAGVSSPDGATKAGSDTTVGRDEAVSTPEGDDAGARGAPVDAGPTPQTNDNLEHVRETDKGPTERGGESLPLSAEQKPQRQSAEVVPLVSAGQLSAASEVDSDPQLPQAPAAEVSVPPVPSPDPASPPERQDRGPAQGARVSMNLNANRAAPIRGLASAPLGGKKQSS